jgi:carbon starvation protein
VRRDGRSLGDLIKLEIGAFPGVVALFGCFMIIVILLAVLALIVVKALTHSPWGTFTVAATIPIAVFMGIYMRYLRPGQIIEISVIGFTLLMAAILLGGQIADHPTLRVWFDLSGTQLTWALMIYGFIAAVIPVWLLLAPRDYLSTFLKIGTIVALAVGVLFVAPDLRMPAITQFIDGSGPVWSGDLFPFLFITIACGAVSGFHSLVASGTTPKMIESEGHIRFIGYGAMLMESFVAIMALIAASVIDPGVYFAMNSPAALIGTTPEAVAQVVSQWGFVVTPDVLNQITQDIGETTILSRAGGAPTLAVGMAHILHQAVGGAAMMAFWYHFAILFEALFILTTIDAGTRVGRFMLQDLLGTFSPSLKRTTSWPANVLATAMCVAMWGYFLYQGVVDPLGGINTLWPLFGIANQMLAVIALTLCVVVLVKMKRHQYAWVAMIPTVFLLTSTLTAAWEKVFNADPKVGFLALADRFAESYDQGIVLAPAHSLDEMSRLIFNNRVDAGLTILFMSVVVTVVGFGVRKALLSMRNASPTAREAPYEAA